MIVIKSQLEIEAMQEAGRITAKALRVVGEAVRVGVTTAELDRIAEECIRGEGAVPAFKGYHGFPGTLCTSINEQVVHGIPAKRRLADGDILSVDCGAVIDGFYGDSALTFPVGTISTEAKALLDATAASLQAGIARCREGMRLYDIGAAVQDVAERAGFSVVREYVGHGIGRAMHEDPQVPNFGKVGTGPALKVGMVIAIEPMVNAGKYDVYSLSDGWTVVTADSSLSAHFEHTVAVTEEGPLILTVE
ncbi:MAG: type I methionyl aminopeptidase [Coriobacteriia bacterium]|nr:type I methionyl aminopeptidase [Coriobacteriia bacterium]MBN2823287.1 type I methionyl aminopeptidase [Coriobacteriia bacterium]